MEASELIEILTGLVEEHGDLDCRYEDDGRDRTISQVKYDKTWDEFLVR